jgi:RNA polymerase sigma-70 factor, ECF subfamily
MAIVTPSVEEAFLALLNQYQGAIRRVCWTYAAASEDREEIFQEIVYQLWRSFPSFRGRSAPLTWIYRVALNTAITAMRRRGRRPAQVSLEPSHERSSNGPRVDERTSQIERLYRAIRQLDTVDRALVMCYLDDMSYKRIGEVLGLSEANVGTRLNRAKARLQAIVRIMD